MYFQPQSSYKLGEALSIYSRYKNCKNNLTVILNKKFRCSYSILLCIRLEMWYLPLKLAIYVVYAIHYITASDLFSITESIANKQLTWKVAQKMGQWPPPWVKKLLLCLRSLIHQMLTNFHNSINIQQYFCNKPNIQDLSTLSTLSCEILHCVPKKRGSTSDIITLENHAQFL